MKPNSSSIPISNSRIARFISEIPLRWWVVIIFTELCIGLIIGFFPSVSQPERWIVGFILAGYFCIALIRPNVSAGIFLFFFPLYNIELRVLLNGRPYYFFILPAILGWLLAIALLLRTTSDLHFLQKHQIFLIIPTFLLTLWSAVSNLWTINHDAPWVVTIHFLIAIAVIYVLFQLVQSEKILRRFIWIVLWSGMITATAIILSTLLSKSYQYFYHLFQATKLSVNLAVFFDLMTHGCAMGFGTHNKMALLMVVHIFLAVALLVTSTSRKEKWFLSIAILYMLYAHLLTKTRAPLLGMLLGAMVTIILLSERIQQLRYKKIFLGIVVVGICFIFMILVILGNFEKEFYRFASPGVGIKETSWTLRVVWWEQSLLELINSYGFGTGAGNVYTILYENAPHPHNSYMHLIAELGLVGIILLITILISIFRKTRMALRKKEIPPSLQRMLAVFAGALVAFGFSVGFEYDYYMTATWLYLAILLSPINLALNLSKENIDKNQK